MRSFAEACPDAEKVKQLVSQLPWGHVIRLLQRVKETEVREWYVRESIEALRRNDSSLILHMCPEFASECGQLGANAPALEARGVSRRYRLGDRLLSVLQEVSLTVAVGEFLVIEGASGSGKTTLLSLLSGLDKPSQGRVLVEGCDITAVSEDGLAPLRNRTFGFVFQSFHLIPALSALENISLPAELAGAPRALERARTLMERVGLAQRADSFPHQLSGGEKQRVALCRALINRPRILFADEPTGNLDSENGRVVLDLLREFHREMGVTLVLVTHNAAIAQTAGRIIRLRDGRVVGEERHAP
jgi:putative ABC transport system ATP-binding protein